MVISLSWIAFLMYGVHFFSSMSVERSHASIANFKNLKRIVACLKKRKKMRS